MNIPNLGSGVRTRGTPPPDTCTQNLKPQSRLQLKYCVVAGRSTATRDYPVYTQPLKSDGEFTKKKCGALSSWRAETRARGQERLFKKAGTEQKPPRLAAPPARLHVAGHFSCAQLKEQFLGVTGATGEMRTGKHGRFSSTAALSIHPAPWGAANPPGAPGPRPCRITQGVQSPPSHPGTGSTTAARAGERGRRCSCLNHILDVGSAVFYVPLTPPAPEMTPEKHPRSEKKKQTG